MLLLWQIYIVTSRNCDKLTKSFKGPHDETYVYAL